MTEKQEFVEKVEEPQQAIEITEEESVVEPTATEETAEKPSEETVANSEIKELAANMQEILVQVNVIAREKQINDNLHKKLQEYENGLKEALIATLLKAVVREYDRTSKQYRFYLEKSQTEPQSELFNKLLSEFELLSFSLLNILNDCDYEPFEFNTGDAFDRKLQKIVEDIEIEDQQQVGTVAECVTCGFSNTETGKLLRQAEVKIYKLKK
jgi:molecular chaperone GrpE (heat shock protein)